MSHPSRVATAVAERHEAVERLTRAGLTIPEITQRIGLSRTSIVRIRRQSGVAKPKRTPLTPAAVSRAAQLLDDGASIAEVTRTLGCGRSQIDDRFPGRAWTRQRTIDHLRTLRHLVGNHSADQIDIAWRTIRRTGRVNFEQLSLFEPSPIGAAA